MRKNSDVKWLSGCLNDMMVSFVSFNNGKNMRLVKLLILGLFSLPTWASDFVSFPDNKPQTLSNQNTVQVISFWATYCLPCRQEMPEMSRWYQKTGKKQKVQMVGIAIDNEQNVRKFLKQTPVHYPIWLYTGKDSRSMMKTFGNKIGALPYTVVRLPKCHKEQALLGKVDETLLNQTITQLKKSCQ